MNSWFDELAKALAAGVSRREVALRFSVGIAGIRWKLGRCPRCMRAAARGTFAAWIVAAILAAACPHPVPWGLALGVALAFTALFFAHMLAYLSRRVPRVLGELEGRLPQETDFSRRRFLDAGLRMGATAVMISLSGFGRVVLASEEKKCQGHTERINSFCISDSSREDAVLSLRSSASGACFNSICHRFERDNTCQTRQCISTDDSPKFISFDPARDCEENLGVPEGDRERWECCADFLCACECDPPLDERAAALCEPCCKALAVAVAAQGGDADNTLGQCISGCTHGDGPCADCIGCCSSRGLSHPEARQCVEECAQGQGVCGVRETVNSQTISVSDTGSSPLGSVTVFGTVGALTRVLTPPTGPIIITVELDWEDLNAVSGGITFQGTGSNVLSFTRPGVPTTFGFSQDVHFPDTDTELVGSATVLGSVNADGLGQVNVVDFAPLFTGGTPNR
jgi:hypothetical protein